MASRITQLPIPTSFAFGIWSPCSKVALEQRAHVGPVHCFLDDHKKQQGNEDNCCENNESNLTRHPPPHLSLSCSSPSRVLAASEALEHPQSVPHEIVNSLGRVFNPRETVASCLEECVCHLFVLIFVCLSVCCGSTQL
jgi:hypothetical protein